MASKHYLKDFAKKSKSMLPDWMFKSIHAAARGHAGGKASVASKRSAKRSAASLNKIAKMDITKAIEEFVKSQPGSSSVHVPSTEWRKKDFPTNDQQVAPTAPPADAHSTERSRGVEPPLVANLEAEILKAVGYGAPETDQDDHSDYDQDLALMQEYVSGMDWEMSQNELDEGSAREVAAENLEKDPDYYRELRAKQDGTDDPLNQGLNIDLCSGPVRKGGHIGFDLYPHDSGTIVHDLNMGIPAGDESAQNVRLVNGLSYMEMEDKTPLLKEIHRVLKPGGKFQYEGPDELADHENWSQHAPGLVLTDHEETSQNVEKNEGSPWVRQSYSRVAIPDPATANDAAPRVGIPGTVPFDAELAMDSFNYAWDDTSTTARGNRAYGYPSQGAVTKEGAYALPAEKLYPINDVNEAIVALNECAGRAEEENVKNAVYRKFPELTGKPKEPSSTEAVIGEVMAHVIRNILKEQAEPRRVATVAIRHGDHLLMGKRRDNGKWTVPGGHVDAHEDMHQGALREIREEAGIKVNPAHLEEVAELDKSVDANEKPLHVQPYQVMLTERPSTSMLKDPDGEVERWQWVDVKDGIPQDIASNLHVPLERNCLFRAVGLSSQKDKERAQKIEKTVSEPRMVPIKKLDKAKQVVYCVVLSPDELDAQDDWMTSDDIEDAAHLYMRKSRVIGADHSRTIDAEPVESYIAPQDLEWGTGPYGPQIVKKGSWVLGIKVHDPKEWSKVASGDYQGVSVGGFGVRD